METVAIQTRFMGPTNHRGARIVATTSNGHKIIRPFDYAARNPHAAVAAELARSMGWTGHLICGGTENGYVFVQQRAFGPWFCISDGLELRADCHA